MKKTSALMSAVAVILILSLFVTIFIREKKYDYDNLNYYSFGFSISDKGNASLKINYDATSTSLIEMRLWVIVQRKQFNIFWCDVEIDDMEKRWILTSPRIEGGSTIPIQVKGSISKTFYLKERGQYRAVFIVEIEEANDKNYFVEKIEYRYV